MDFLEGAAFKRMLLTQQHVNNIHVTGPTSSAIPSVEAKVIRGACQNGAVVALMYLEEESFKHLLATMVHTAYPLTIAQGESSAARSVAESVE